MITTGRVPIAAGAGYKYLTKSVAAGDGDLLSADRLIRYYESSGTPPGQWLGSGLAGLGDATKDLFHGDTVTEEQMRLLFGNGQDPLTGELLANRYTVPLTITERIQARIESLPGTIVGQDRADAIATIRKEEKERKTKSPSRSGFDLTFTLPKSVSTLWGISDAGVQSAIAKAHHEAIAETIAMLERDVIATRIGTDGVAQMETHGLIAAAFDHYDSRAGDPHLHTHVVIANRTQGLDGKWRTLDSRALYKSIVAFSRTHDALFQDRLAQYLPITWEQTATGPRATMVTELAGIPPELRKEFSQRRNAILDMRTQAITDFTRKHGREPSPTEQRRLDQTAWKASRPDKTHSSLAELTDSWRLRAAQVLEEHGYLQGSKVGRWAKRTLTEEHHAAAWVSALMEEGTNADRPPILRHDDLTEDQLYGYAADALNVVAENRSTWNRWNIHSQVAALMAEVRFASADDRDIAMRKAVDIALNESTLITPPPLTHTPAAFIRSDGSSAFVAKHSEVFTSQAVLDVEDYLLGRIHDTTATTVQPETVDTVLEEFRQIRPLGEDQAQAVAQIATSGRALDVLVGPAGAGKTTSLRALLEAWHAQHGADSVIGLAPSAAAAAVLGADLEITTDNTAKWLTEHDRRSQREAELAHIQTQLEELDPTGKMSTTQIDQLRRKEAQLQAQIQQWALSTGQLVLVDEASLAGTFALGRLARAAQDAGAKLVLVGDPHQLSAVDAGGAFSLAVHTLGTDAPMLRELHRFAHDWEAKASLGLRTGNAQVLEQYLANGRIADGTDEEMVNSAYAAWQHDLADGHTSLLIAADADTVRELNLRAQSDLQVLGHISDTGGLPLSDETQVFTGDKIITRKNDRTLATSATAWVKNGDRWIVTEARKDGSLLVRRESGGPVIPLPAHYVAQNVELGYASTTHRAQGSTVDRAHAIITGDATSREALYVAATRGRESNNFYVATIDADEHVMPAHQAPTGVEILTKALANVGAEVSAHQQIVAEQDAAGSIARLAAEYDTISTTASDRDYAAMVESAPLDAETINDVLQSSAWPALRSALHKARCAGLPIETTFPRLISAREIGTAEDVASVLQWRVDVWLDKAITNAAAQADRQILGLFPRTPPLADPDAQQGLSEREALMHSRAHYVLGEAASQGHNWAKRPTNLSTDQTQQWQRHALTIAAYRDLYGITTSPDEKPLGTVSETDYAQRSRYQAAAAALQAIHTDVKNQVTNQDYTPAPDEEETIVPMHDRDVSAGMGIFSNPLDDLGAELSAHQQIVDVHDAAGSMATLAAEYATVSTTASDRTYAAMVESAPLDAQTIQDVLQSPGWPALRSTLHKAQCAGLPIETTFPRLISAREIGTAEDVASVLQWRVDVWLDKAITNPARLADRQILGLFPRTPPLADTQTQQVLAQREALMYSRARQVLSQAEAQGHTWATPSPGMSTAQHQQWEKHALTVAAYRDLYAITSSPEQKPLGTASGNDYTQRGHYRAATAALQKLQPQITHVAQLNQTLEHQSPTTAHTGLQ